MLELLKRFEAENADDSFGLQDEDQEEDDLAKRLSNVNLGMHLSLRSQILLTPFQIVPHPTTCGLYSPKPRKIDS